MLLVLNLLLFLAFLVKKTSGLLIFGPKINNPEVFLTRKAKNMNHGSPLFPTYYYINHCNVKKINKIT